MKQLQTLKEKQFDDKDLSATRITKADIRDIYNNLKVIQVTDTQGKPLKILKKPNFKDISWSGDAFEDGTYEFNIGKIWYMFEESKQIKENIMLKKIILTEDNKKLRLKKGQTIFVEQKLQEAMLTGYDKIALSLGGRVIKIVYDFEYDHLADIYFDTGTNVCVHVAMDDEDATIQYLLSKGGYIEEKERIMDDGNSFIDKHIVLEIEE